MTLKQSKFKVGEELSFSGRPVRVAGLVQFEDPGAQVFTRYLLAEAAGAPMILEENAQAFALLRPFPANSQPQTSGNTVTVMGEKYALKGVRKLKVLGSDGQAPGGAPKGPLMLSGMFEGQMGALVREMIPGVPAQSFYSVKPVPAAEVLSGAQLAAKQEAERQVAEMQEEAVAEEAESGKGGWLQKAVTWIVTLAIIGGLMYACSSSEGDDSSGSARSSFHVGGGHGGK